MSMQVRTDDAQLKEFIPPDNNGWPICLSWGQRLSMACWAGFQQLDY